MPLSWFTFGPLSTWANANLDGNFSQVAAQSFIPCTITGTNVLTLTPIVSGFSVSAYQNYMVFSGIAVATNTGLVQAGFASLPTLNVYRDGPAGPIPLSGGEITINNAFFLTYDSMLNNGAGGFHLSSGTAESNSASGSANFTYPAIPPQSQSDLTMTLSGISMISSDVVALGYPSPPQAGIGYLGFVTNASIVTVRAFNYSTSTQTPTSGLYRALVSKVRP